MAITTPAYHHANIEYESTVEFFRRFDEQSIILYRFIMIFTFIGIIIGLKRADITQIMLLAGQDFFLCTGKVCPFSDCCSACSEQVLF